MKKKKQFYNLGRYMCAPGTECEAKKCSERFQGFLNMKKIVLFKYMYCSEFVVGWRCECESQAADSHSPTPIGGAFFLVFFSHSRSASSRECVSLARRFAYKSKQSAAVKLQMYNRPPSCARGKQNTNEKNFRFTYLRGRKTKISLQKMLKNF
jgi:hypothetical protein